MIDLNHKYKVVNSCGKTFVTHDDFQKARQFARNLSKERGIKLQVKNNLQNKDDNHVRA